MRRALLVERTGWTLDYIESLDVDDLDEVQEIYEALDKVRAHKAKQAS